MLIGFAPVSKADGPFLGYTNYPAGRSSGNLGRREPKVGSRAGTGRRGGGRLGRVS